MVGTSSITASSVASTALVFSPAFGGSAGQGRFSEAAGRSVAIDKFGRDYSLNMGALTGSIRGQGVSIASLAQPHNRSEEHTSELQSLMRISYAVFCLKKKNK